MNFLGAVLCPRSLIAFSLLNNLQKTLKQDFSMDTASDSMGESKPVCQCATKSVVQQWLPGFPIALCLLISLSSVTVCLLMTFKTFELENRLQMETNKASTFDPPHRAFLNEDGTLIPELATPVGQLVEKVLDAYGAFN